MSELERSTCYAEGLNPASVIDFLAQLEKIIEPHGIVMIKNNRVILDASYNPYSTSQAHVVNSVTKTFIGISIGTLYDKGLIKLEDKLVSFFPEVEIDHNNKKINEVTIKNVLTMSIGQLTTPAIDDERDWISAMLNNPITNNPGEVFHYDSLATFLLSAVYKKITGKSVSDGLRESLFEPMGITEAYFFDNKQNITIGGLGLFISTKNLAKVGNMLIHGGVHNGKRILSEEWCKLQLAKQIDNSSVFAESKHESRQGYGFQCWHCVNGGIRMSGLWGQMCLMMPEYDFVMAINAKGSSSQPMLDTFNRTVLPALKGEVELKDEQCLLDEFVASRKIKLSNSDFVSYMKEQMNGKEVVTSKNPYNVESFKLSFEDDLVKFEAVRNGKHFECFYKHNDLVKGEDNIVDLFPPYYDELSLPKCELINYHKPNVYGHYKWEDEGTLLLTTLVENEATHFLIRLHYDYKYAAFEWISDVCCTKYERAIIHGKY
ncbi:MAG: serine hydrolase [Firmicutes bacterium]|nr:serine hydrolase [Candidatus Colivicinus equi]